MTIFEGTVTDVADVLSYLDYKGFAGTAKVDVPIDAEAIQHAATVMKSSITYGAAQNNSQGLVTVGYDNLKTGDDIVVYFHNVSGDLLHVQSRVINASEPEVAIRLDGGDNLYAGMGGGLRVGNAHKTFEVATIQRKV